jgi:putative acetyltransferase
VTRPPPARVAIRPYRPADGPALAAIVEAAVRRLGTQDYDARQADAWAARAPDAAGCDALAALAADGRVLLVATDSRDAPLAFGDLEPSGRIHLLYSAPSAAGTGVADALCAPLEAAARARGLSRLFAEASETARPFFLRCGFEIVSRREFRLGDAPIQNYAVEKRLR